MIRASTANMLSRTKLATSGLLAALAFFGWAVCRNLNEPWVMNDSYYGAHYSQAAHNFLRAGLIATGGVPAGLYAGPLPIPPGEFYVHHPTLFPLTVTATFAIFGEAEWVARIVPIVSSLCSAMLLWVLVKRCAGVRAATLSVVAFVTMPMQLHYGDSVDFGPLQTTLILAALAALRRWQITGSLLWRSLMFVAFFLAVWTDWLGFLFASIVAVSLFFGIGGRRDRRTAFALVGIVAVSLALFLLQIRAANPAAWSDLADALQRRSSTGNLRGGAFTFAEWTRTTARYLRTFFLPPHWLLGAAGAVLLFLRRRNWESLCWLGWAAGSIALMDAIYACGLRNQSYVHDSVWFYLSAPLAITCGIALDALAEWRAGRFATTQGIPAKAAAVAGLTLVFAGTAAWSYRRSANVDSQFPVLAAETREPYRLIPELGKTIAHRFAPEVRVICNFDPYGSPLFYYAGRILITGVTEADDWKTIRTEEPAVAGVVWSGADGAAEILASLPTSEQTPVEVCGMHFVFWMPKPSVAEAR